jgi:hypothetical protein
MMLKDLGFSLGQVEHLLEGLTTQQLQGMLVSKSLRHNTISRANRVA